MPQQDHRSASVGSRDSAGRASPGLTPGEFALRYQESARVLWTIAAGVLGSPAQAEDVMQEAATIALQKLGSFERGTSFPAWMGRIVRLVALNQYRLERRRRTPAVDPVVLDTMDLHGSQAEASGAWQPEGALFGPEHHFDDRLLDGLRRLKPNARACLLMRVVLDLDYSEIADALGMPEGTAMSHVHRSRAFLRTHLEQERLIQDRSAS